MGPVLEFPDYANRSGNSCNIKPTCTSDVHLTAIKPNKKSSMMLLCLLLTYDDNNLISVRSTLNRTPGGARVYEVYLPVNARARHMITVPIKVMMMEATRP